MSHDVAAGAKLLLQEQTWGCMSQDMAFRMRVWPLEQCFFLYYCAAGKGSEPAYGPMRQHSRNRNGASQNKIGYRGLRNFVLGLKSVFNKTNKLPKAFFLSFCCNFFLFSDSRSFGAALLGIF